MALSVVLFDVVKLGSVVESGIIPIQMPQPFVEVGITGPNHAVSPRYADLGDPKSGLEVPYVAYVTLEMLHIDRIKAHDRGEKTDVRFGDMRSRQQIWR